MDLITQLLAQVRAEDAYAREALTATVYRELLPMARARMRDDGDRTVLVTTALVDGCCRRLVRCGELRAADRRGFFAFASPVMQSLIVNCVQERAAERRRGGAPHLRLSNWLADELGGDEQALLKMHQILGGHALWDRRLAQFVQMAYFGGYSETELVEVLGIDAHAVRHAHAGACLVIPAILKGERGLRDAI